jgi:hypothetical protein
MPARPTPIRARSSAFGNTGLNITNNVITGSNNDRPTPRWSESTSSRRRPIAAARSPATPISYVDTGIGVYGDITPTGILIANNRHVLNIDLTDPYAAGVDFEPNPALITPYDVDGSAGDDILIGGAGDGQPVRLGGSDLFTGNGGDDLLDGGADTDTATYSGPRSGYDVGVVTDASGPVIGFSYVHDIMPAMATRATTL